MSIDLLTQALVAEAETEAEAIRADARAEAARLDTRADADRRAHREDDLARWRAVCEAEAQREVAASARRVRLEVLKERALMLERLRAAVGARLPELLGDPALASAMVADAVEMAGGRAASVRASPVLRDVARARVPPAVEVLADVTVGSGVTVALTGGRAFVTVSLESALERQWPRLQIEALAALAAEDQP